jgi:hypothetical protein
VERTATSETVEEPVLIVGVWEAGNVGARATLDSFAPTNGNEKRTVKGWCWTHGLSVTLSGCHLGWAHLRREWW